VKAVVLRSPRVLEYMDVPAPQLKQADDILIQVKACGICGSDLRYWEGENPCTRSGITPITRRTSLWATNMRA
jgi:threonine dehydrogenase-like Zn-dependent dehydrogenase